ncbi:hypothetical protein NQ315_005781 [Exocentrus adspersus]|uniref:PPIase cyclophilin-type domain-containing protein n=1 Tax=Exocentrus adspersus TaxID=1586481 RepID=A0AAV8VS64_9CUCU|nr:hypothetical protein NQ315_005781 [Exocentrus adspersus]
MSVVIETTVGDITVDLFSSDRPRACLNFLKLCKIKYYNFSLFHTISRGFIAQTGDPSGSRSGGESIYGVLDGPKKRFFEGYVNKFPGTDTTEESSKIVYKPGKSDMKKAQAELKEDNEDMKKSQEKL